MLGGLNFQYISPSQSLEFPALFLTGYDFLFAIAFLLGLITLNTLALVREKGEADRETVLNELHSQTRDNFRVLNSVPGMSIVSHFPYSSYLRYVPHVPGLDVAIGVTALQIATTTRDAVAVAGRSSATAADVAGRVGHAVSAATGQAGRLGRRYGVGLAINATRGAMHAITDATLGVQHVAEGAVRGTVSALGKRVANTSEVLWGAGYGVVQGAIEAGTDLAQAARHAVEGARVAARELGISEQEAAAEAAGGAVEAAEAQGPAAAARVKEAVLDELLDNVLPESRIENRE